MTPGRRLRAYAVGAAALVVVVGIVVAANRGPGGLLTARPTPARAPSASPTPAPGPRVLEIQFLSASVGYLSTPGEPARIYRTGDGGATWSVSFEGPTPQFTFFDAEHGVAWNQKMGSLATVDGGFSWRPATWPHGGAPAAVGSGAGGEGLALFIDPADGNDRVYRTADAGLTWSLVASWASSLYSGLTPSLGLGTGGLGWVLWESSKTRVLTVSRDAGATWVRAPLPPPPSAGMVAPSIRLSAAGATLVLTTQWLRPGVTAPEGDVLTYLYELAPASVTWRSVPLRSQPLGMYAAALGPSGAGFLLGGSQDCLLPASGPPECTSPGLGAVVVDRLDLVETGFMLAVDHRYGAGYFSRDGGRHWSLLRLPDG